jgi:hypothetical protein
MTLVAGLSEPIFPKSDWTFFNTLKFMQNKAGFTSKTFSFSFSKTGSTRRVAISTKLCLNIFKLISVWTFLKTFI